MIERCALTLAGALLSLPCFGQGPVEGVASARTDARLRQSVEVVISSARGLGVRNVQQLLQQISDAAQRRGAGLPDDFVDWLSAVDDGLLPATLRVYLPVAWDQAGDPPYVLCTLDAADELPVEKWLGMRPAAAPGGVAIDRRGSFFRTVDLPAGGQRLVFGDGWKHLEPSMPRFSGPQLPDGSPSFRAMRQRVQHGALHAVVDAAGFAPPEVVRSLGAAGGPRGNVFGLSVARARGRTNLDVHWGCGIGSGMVGALLPRTSSSSGLSRLLPFEAGLALQAKLGSSFAEKLLRSGLLRQLPDRDARATLEEVLEVWEGELGWFQPVPPRGYDPLPYAPASIRISPEIVCLIRVAKDAGDDLIETIATVIGKGVRDPDTGTLRLDERHNALHIGHRAGIVAICRAAKPERAAALMQDVLSAAAGSRRARGSVAPDRELRAPVQFSVSPRLAAHMFEQLAGDDDSRADDPASIGYSLGRALTREAFSHGYGMSLTWDENNMRLRFRF